MMDGGFTSSRDENTERIHSVLTWVSLSISQELQGSVSATTKSRLVFSILFAWNSLWKTVMDSKATPYGSCKSESTNSEQSKNILLMLQKTHTVSSSHSPAARCRSLWCLWSRIGFGWSRSCFPLSQSLQQGHRLKNKLSTNIQFHSYVFFVVCFNPTCINISCWCEAKHGVRC